jgi:hypothetical protein
MFGYLILIVVAVAVIALVTAPQFKGYRTTVFGWAVTVMGGLTPLLTDLTGYLQTLDWQQYLPAKYVPWALLVIGVLIIILRRLTTGPVGTK